MIQTSIRNDKGETETLDHNDPRYWQGAYTYIPYPKALYRQLQPGQPVETKVVQHQSEREKLGSDWHESPGEAIEHFQRLESDIAKAAAERSYGDSLLSAKAQREALATDRATDELLPEIPARRSHKKMKPE